MESRMRQLAFHKSFIRRDSCLGHLGSSGFGCTVTVQVNKELRGSVQEEQASETPPTLWFGGDMFTSVMGN